MILLGVVLAACTSESQLTEQTDAPSVVSFRASGINATRTSFNEQTLAVDWAAGDNVAVWATKGESMALEGVSFTATEIDSLGATFSTFLTQMERGEYTYYSVYPAPANVEGTVVSFDIPSVQTGAYDCAADVLVAEPATALALTQKGAALNLHYKHALHALRLDVPGGLDNYGNTIETIKVTFPAAVVGTVKVDAIGENATTVEGDSVIVVDCFEQMAAGADVWAFIAPADFTDEQITIEITAAGNTATFEVAGRNFRAGYISRVIMAMPEVLILDEARTLIDNNLSSAITDPTAANLAVRLGGIDLTDVVRGGVEYTNEAGEVITVESTLPEGTQSFELALDGLASGVYSMRGWVELPDSTILYSEVAEGVRVVGNVGVTMGEINSAYTYYLSSGASTANSKNGSSIYAATSTFDMNSAFVDEVDEVGISVDGVNYAGTQAGLTFDVAEIADQSWSNHKVEAYVVVGGVKFTSESTSVVVTGIPYSVSMVSSSLPGGWQGGNIKYAGYSGSAADTQECVRLDRQEKAEGNNTDTGWLVSPGFYLPDNVSASMVFNTYHYRADTSSKEGYLYVNPSSGERVTAKNNSITIKSSNSYYDQATFKDYSCAVDLTPTNNCISVTSAFTGKQTFNAIFFTQPYADYFTIKTASVLYR